GGERRSGDLVMGLGRRGDGDPVEATRFQKFPDVVEDRHVRCDLFGRGPAGLGDVANGSQGTELVEVAHQVLAPVPAADHRHTWHRPHRSPDFVSPVLVTEQGYLSRVRLDFLLAVQPQRTGTSATVTAHVTAVRGTPMRTKSENRYPPGP